MSAIQRFEPRIETANIQPYMNPCKCGDYCRYTDLLWYKRQYWMAVVMLVVTCAVFSTVLLYDKAARGPVVVPTGGGEKADLREEVALKEKVIKDLKDANASYKAQIRHLNERMTNVGKKIDIVQSRGAELDRPNKEQSQRMSTHRGLVLEAKRVLGVNVQVIE